MIICKSYNTFSTKTIDHSKDKCYKGSKLLAKIKKLSKQKKDAVFDAYLVTLPNKKDKVTDASSKIRSIKRLSWHKAG